MQSESPAIDLTGVSHRYDAKLALWDITLALPQGSTMVLVGPDGAGKSTLLALIAGVKRLQDGQLRILGRDAASSVHRDTLASQTAYMPQGLGRNLYPTLSVFENVDFMGRLFGLETSARHRRIERLLRATALDPFLHRPAGKLSGGMKQKLSLCSVLIHEPELLVLDEPTTGIDPLSRRQFWSLLAEIKSENPSMTLIVSTAYMEEAAVFDHVALIDGGRLLAVGPTASVLEAAHAATVEEAFLELTLGEPGRRRQDFVLPPRVETGDGPPAIAAEGLTRRFGDFTAVEHVSFRIERGEIFGFLGSNGCGKTTTMKMLTGLLPISAGRAELLGRPVEASDIETRLRVGYMSQSFSLYEELTVRANLELHARLYRLAADEVPTRVRAALRDFDLADVADEKPAMLPLGQRQRLQLAAACLHRPEVLILDEPTSGVDPAARDMFWVLLGILSRRDGITIFISTHFMNEAERCDRVSLMHAGRVLAVGTPRELIERQRAASLESVFIQLLEADNSTMTPRPQIAATERVSKQVNVQASPPAQTRLAISARRIWAFARREAMEILRDKIRLAFAFLGPIVLLVTFGYGITFDVDRLAFAVLDRDQSIESRRLLDQFTGSRYFIQRPPIGDDRAIDLRLRSGELQLVVSIPPGFGRDLLSGRRPEIGFFLDGAPTFRAETARGYIEGVIQTYVAQNALRSTIAPSQLLPVEVKPRFLYNQDFRSVVSIVPGSIMLVLAFIPSMLAALGIVREREIGSISNLYCSPASVGEFLVGKQLPYVVLSFVSFLMLVVLAVIHFGVAVKGSVIALILGGLLYVFAMTGLGIFVSSFVRTQVAALIATAVICAVPALQFSGFLYPAATLEGAAYYVGHGFPALWFQNVSLGTFAKGGTFGGFILEQTVLFVFGVAFLLAARTILRKQEV